MVDRNKVDEIMAMVDSLMDFVEENDEMIDRLQGGGSSGGDTVDLSDQTPLREAIRDDDRVIIASEVKGEVSSINVSEDDGEVVIGINGQELRTSVPNDVDIDGTSANVNNGVLEVEIPRTGDSQ